MASTNGQPDVMQSSATLPAKRKRDDSIGTQNRNHSIAGSSTAESTDPSHEDSQTFIRDLIDILKIHDTSPSILTRPLPDRPSKTIPQAKRQKSEDGPESQTSILTRVSEDIYRSVDEVLEDIDTAVSDITNKLQLPNGAAKNQYIPIPATQSDITNKVTAFKKEAHRLVKRERVATGKDVKKIQLTSRPLNYSAGNGAGANPVVELNAGQTESKMVLTLYGSAPVPKQLFSSLQIPVKVAGEEKDILQTLREAGLPNGISTTQIIPMQATGLVDEKKRTPTLGELFPTPSSVPVLKVPTLSKVASTKSSVVGWYQPTSGEPGPRNASYFRQAISTGQWLDYSNASPISQATKKKQRDRALSLSTTKAPEIESDPAESESAKLDALFRGAYTSFAPTKDDAAAVAPTGMVDRLWWQQIGEKSFERMLSNEKFFEEATTSTVEEIAEEDYELKQFEEAIAAYEQDVIDPSLVSLNSEVERSAEEKDVDEILQGISELLETLNSYQRIRHVSLNTTSRPTGLLSGPDATSTGTPTQPSEPEQATYEILRSQLTLMIATLPPYAVAKLDADRLADLKISTRIEAPLNNYHGVMEEDEAAARAKVAALSAASASTRAAAPSTAHRSSTPNLYGNQYSASRTAPPPAQPYHGSSQTPIRPPSSMQRPLPVQAGSYQQGVRPAATPLYRPTTYGTPTYPHQNPRPVQQPYQTPGQTPYHASPAQSYMRPPSQSYPNYGQQLPQAAPQPAMNGRYPNQPYAHQAQPQQNGMNYNYGNVANNIPRQASPQKPMYSPQPTPAQPRPYASQTPSIQQAARPYYQNPISQGPMMNGTPTQAAPPQYAHQQAGLTSYSTFMTQEQQSSLLERQRAQLAAQQAGTQHMARSAAQAAMGTPSAAQINGGNPVPAGL